MFWGIGDRIPRNNVVRLLIGVVDRPFQAPRQSSRNAKVKASKVERSAVSKYSIPRRGVKQLADHAVDGVVVTRNCDAQLLGEVLLPDQFHRLDSLRLQIRGGFISWRIVE